MQPTVSFYATYLYKHFSAFCNEKLGEMGLSQGLLYFILYIGKHPQCSPGQLSSSLNFDTGHTTRSVDKLVQSGFVSRQKSEQDRRAYVLCLTEKGNEAFAVSRTLFQEWDDLLLSDLSETEKKELLLLLQKLKIRKEQYL